jgi:hypothetical protein
MAHNFLLNSIPNYGKIASSYHCIIDHIQYAEQVRGGLGDDTSSWQPPDEVPPSEDNIHGRMMRYQTRNKGKKPWKRNAYSRNSKEPRGRPWGGSSWLDPWATFLWIVRYFVWVSETRFTCWNESWRVAKSRRWAEVVSAGKLKKQGCLLLFLLPFPNDNYTK